MRSETILNLVLKFWVDCAGSKEKKRPQAMGGKVEKEEDTGRIEHSKWQQSVCGVSQRRCNNNTV